MDKETLSNYGWIVICVLVLAVMIALAGPFGNFVAGAVKSTTAGLFGVNQNALGAAGIEIGDQAFDEGDNGGQGGTNSIYDHNAPELHPNDGTTPTNGDVYTAGDYKYTYKSSENGWVVAINTAVTNKDKSTYGPILESINGKPITSMVGTFEKCTALTTAPVIPNSVTNMVGTFGGCVALTTAPVIPNSVTNMLATFQNCTSLTTAPDMSNANSVTDMLATFENCTSLIDLSSFIIPSTVTDLTYTFQGCSALITAPVIPSNVKKLSYTFSNCKSLSGLVVINASPTISNYVGCFNGIDFTVQNITLAGDSTNLDAIGSTHYRGYCAVCNGTCKGTH